MNDNNYEGLNFPFPKDKTLRLIKVIGVGGGGGNAVKNMYEKGVTNVGFAICNTDSQALNKSSIPVKIQLGDGGLGVGGVVEKARQAAEESIESVCRLFDEDTKMVFITAGMGGGTGTGAAPVIAKAAREKGLLTVGVVTLPFAFEQRSRIEKALCGVEELKKYVDALLVINNERLLEVYNDGLTTMEEAFAKADEVLTTATKTIAEIITEEGIVNRDFCDVETVMKNGGSAIVSIGYGEGENRIIKAMNQALNSPLMNTLDMNKAKRLLYIIYTCKDCPVTISETRQVNDFMDGLSNDLQVLWGFYNDDTIKNQVKVALVATGFDREEEDEKEEDLARQKAIQTLMEFYYPKRLETEDKPEKESVSEESSTTTETDISEENDCPVKETADNPVPKRNWFFGLMKRINDILDEEM